jgi:hypothetical protein
VFPSQVELVDPKVEPVDSHNHSVPITSGTGVRLVPVLGGSLNFFKNHRFRLFEKK